MNEWPDVTCTMKFAGEATAYYQHWEEIQDIYRSSTSNTCEDLALEPLRAAVTKNGPEISELCKERNSALKDYDSYKRRLKALEAKRDALEVRDYFIIYNLGHHTISYWIGGWQGQYSSSC